MFGNNYPQFGGFGQQMPQQYQPGQYQQMPIQPPQAFQPQPAPQMQYQAPPAQYQQQIPVQEPTMSQLMAAIESIGDEIRKLKEALGGV